MHKWLQKQAITVMSIYQKFAPSKENMKPKLIYLNLAQLQLSEYLCLIEE